MEELALVLPSLEWEKQAEDYRWSYFENGEEHIHGSSAMERYPGYSE